MNKLALHSNFETLIENFATNQIGICDHFLSEELAAKLKIDLISLFQDDQFNSAGTGNHETLQTNQLIRKDKIYWLDRNHNNPFQNSFFDLLDDFIVYLNSTCFTGISGYEFHYTYYEKDSFYKKHIDQFKNNNDRAFSMIIYLNENWKKEDGGELNIFQCNSSQLISPLSGKCVFFKSSELAHEVLVTQLPRLSITGWLKTN